jgi:hypothetical protein
MTLQNYIDGLKRAIELDATNRALQNGKSASSWKSQLGPELVQFLEVDPFAELATSSEFLSDLQVILEALGKNRSKVPDAVLRRMEAYATMAKPSNLPAESKE